MENPRLEQTSYTYDLNERLTQTGLANGGNEQRSYDIADRLTSVVNYDSLDNVQTAYSYVLDNVGNRTQMSDYVGAVTQYAYNQRDELLWEGVVASPLSWNSFTLAQWVAFTLAQWVDFVLNDVPSESVTYTYDNVGNRLTMTSSGAVTTSTYDAANQLQTSIAPGGAVTTYSYDGAGNLVGENVAGAATSYIFDGPNRLTDVYPATGSDVTFVYDPDGRRVQKAVGAELTRFVWDGERLLVENDAANTPQVEYTQSDSGFGNLVSEYQTGGGSFQHAFDGLGSTGALLDDSGAVADRWAYSAFGLQETAPADEPTRLTFGGQLGYQYDLELDLYYCRNRYYDPVTGRWVNQDPAKADPINNYRYCGNNPVTKSDPSGLAYVGPAQAQPRRYIPPPRHPAAATIAPKEDREELTAKEHFWLVVLESGPEELAGYARVEVEAANKHAGWAIEGIETIAVRIARIRSNTSLSEKERHDLLVEESKGLKEVADYYVQTRIDAYHYLRFIANPQSPLHSETAAIADLPHGVREYADPKLVDKLLDQMRRYGIVQEQTATDLGRAQSFFTTVKAVVDVAEYVVGALVIVQSVGEALLKKGADAAFQRLMLILVANKLLGDAAAAGASAAKSAGATDTEVEVGLRVATATLLALPAVLPDLPERPLLGAKVVEENALNEPPSTAQPPVSTKPGAIVESGESPRPSTSGRCCARRNTHCHEPNWYASDF